MVQQRVKAHKKILVVDDDIDILEPLELLLEAEGYRVETTTKGEQTYAKVMSFKPDLILLDVLMSGSDGRMICKQLKNDEVTKNIKIVMMSAHPSAKGDSKGSEADDFIAKPFEIVDLFRSIKSCLK